jgi:hypothetical protein
VTTWDSPLREPAPQVNLTRWQHKAMTALAADQVLAWSAVHDVHGHPDARQIRRFFGWLEEGGAVAWDPYRVAWWLRDREALYRLLRWEQRRSVTAALRTRQIADAPRLRA